jgi:hypothetical protein
MNQEDYDNDGNNIVPCQLCLSVYCKSKENGKCPEEDKYVKDMNQKQSCNGILEKLLSEYDDWYLVESNTKELKARHEARKNFIENIFKQAIQTREREISEEVEKVKGILVQATIDEMDSYDYAK